MSLFDKRINFKPYEYPKLIGFKDSIRHSYWLHTEYNITSDVQDFKSNISSIEKSVITKTLLAISQIEISVKTFWAEIYSKMPKPEIGAVGMTFAESEVRHADAYAFLLENLGLNKEFENISKVPAIMNRIQYLSSQLRWSKGKNNEKYTLSLLLFSVFVERVSLFSQFLIIMSFNKYKNIFKGLSNIVEATSKEEEIHGKFGIEIVKIIKKENPEWFDSQFEKKIQSACFKAEAAEEKILNWIFEDGELDFLPKSIIKNFIKNRLNNSLEDLNISPVFEINPNELSEILWFDEEVLVTKDLDFFYKRSTAYSKMQYSIQGEDLF